MEPINLQSGTRRPVRVLIVTPDFPPDRGGIQRLMFELASNFDGMTCRVVTIGAHGSGQDDRGLRVDRVPDLGGVLHPIAVARLNLRALWRSIAFRPDVVISGHATTAPGSLAMGALLGVRVIQYLHSDEIRQRPRLVSAAVRRADAVVAVSAHARDIAIEAGAPRERVHIVNPGVASVQALKGKPTTSLGATVLTVARLADRYKGHDLMLRALPLVRSQRGDIQWIIVGDGPLRPALEHLAQALGVEHAVRFTGEVSEEERDEWFDRADLFVMPSRLPAGGLGGEGFGIVYLEAAARGVPVVAGNVGGAIDAVGDSGVLIDPRDHVALADAIVDLLSDASRRSHLATHAAERAKQFSWARHVQSVQALILELGEK